MCGAGDRNHYEAVTPLLDCYSRESQLLGGPGAGQYTKMANQIMIGTQQTGIVEALIFGHKAGLNLDQMIKILKGGGAGSFWLENFGPKMLKRDFGPGFYVEHFV